MAIGQRALLIRTPAGNVLWDCIGYLDDDLAAEVEELGGIDAIAVSHPHFYGLMIEWGRAFDAPVYIHAADREWVGRPDPVIEFWTGDTHEILPASRWSTRARTSLAARCCTGVPTRRDGARCSAATSSWW